MWITLLRIVALSALVYFTTPKLKPPPPPGFEELTIPNSDEGGEYPVIWGTPIIRDPWVPLYGLHRTRAIRSRGGKK